MQSTFSGSFPDTLFFVHEGRDQTAKGILEWPILGCSRNMASECPNAPGACHKHPQLSTGWTDRRLHRRVPRSLHPPTRDGAICMHAKWKVPSKGKGVIFLLFGASLGHTPAAPMSMGVWWKSVASLRMRSIRTGIQ